jgi:hypothetical protein
MILLISVSEVARITEVSCGTQHLMLFTPVTKARMPFLLHGLCAPSLILVHVGYLPHFHGPSGEAFPVTLGSRELLPPTAS